MDLESRNPALRCGFASILNPCLGVFRLPSPLQDLDSVGRLMVNLTDPNSYPPGGRTWAVAFIGMAGDLPLLTAEGGELLPEPSAVSRTLQTGDGYNSYPDEDIIAYWPSDSAAISVWESQRCVLLISDAEGRGAEGVLHLCSHLRALSFSIIGCFRRERAKPRNGCLSTHFFVILQGRIRGAGTPAARGWQCLGHCGPHVRRWWGWCI